MCLACPEDADEVVSVAAVAATVLEAGSLGADIAAAIVVGAEDSRRTRPLWASRGRNGALVHHEIATTTLSVM
jgi:hypothetical protein